MEIIHIVLGKANPNRMNGVNKVVNSLAIYQTHLGHRVSVWGIANDLKRNFPQRNYKTKLFRASKNKWQLNIRLKARILTALPGTVFHIHGGFIPEFVLITRTILRAGLDYIFTPHGAFNKVAMAKSKWTKKLYYRLFEKRIIEGAKRVHCIGQSEVDALSVLNRRVKAVLIPNGQNLEELQYRHKSLGKRKKIVFGFCGRIDIHTKGLDYLLKGFAEFSRNNKEQGELWIIGGGGEIKALKSLAQKLDITDQVTFWGKQFGEEKLNTMANMDTFFHPSRNEGLPGAVLEAAGLGVPCIVSKESNMSGYIDEYQCGVGLLENNEQAITRAMQDMLEIREEGGLTDLKEQAKIMIRQEFNWSGIAQKLINVYQD